MSLWLPNAGEIMQVHELVAEYSGGSACVRDAGLIESAAARATASFGGVDAYPDALEKIAALACGLVQNHGFVDGNKRIGVVMLLLMLRRNGLSVSYTQQELVTLGLSLAEGRTDVSGLRGWLEAHLTRAENT